MKKILLWAAILLAAIFVLWGAFVAYHGFHLVQTARELNAEIKAEKSDLTKLQSGALGIAADIDAIHSAVGPVVPAFTSLQGMPLAGRYLGQVGPLLDLSREISQAGRILMDVFFPVLSQSGETGDNKTTPEKIFSAVLENSKKLDQAARFLDQAAVDWGKIDPSVIPGQFRDLFLKADAYVPMLGAAIPALRQVPALLGDSGETRFLVLAQNRDEMRATGGFISGIGLAAIQNGKMTGFSLGDSYTIDDFTKPYPTPPDALKQWMLADYWVTRDANWSPDFPTSARKAQELYTLSTGMQTQGVIAFNQLAVKGILGATGEVTIAGYPEPIRADTVENFMHQSWAPDPVEGITPGWWANRKKFMGDLGKVILAKVLDNSDPKALLGLGEVIVDLMKSGQLLIYTNQPEINALLALGELDGSVQAKNGDTLYLVDSNIGFNKVDTVIKRDLTYQIDLSQVQHPTAAILASYQHEIQTQVPCKHEATYGKGTYADMQTRCYWDYWRIYLPAGSKLSGSSVPSIPAAMLLNKTDWNGLISQETGEKGLEVLSGLMVLATNSQQENKLLVELPPSVVYKTSNGGWIYRLRIQKQPGLIQLPVTIRVKIPANNTPADLQAGWVSEGNQVWAWHGGITQAQDFQFAFCCAQ